ncbi:hypothetical protein [Burkholderia plantarii]|uniref:hypothetical protein n=1 Tax=Burkholderia plantarii TaxID=41899 RepID=UPI001F5B69B8|nr:hypothetical protein [Burkholderia plantarii]
MRNASDDLLVGIALDALGAGVPVRHVAVGREHEDRVVHHALHEQAKAPFALEHGVVVGLVAGDVAHHLDEPGRPPLPSDAAP